MCRWLSHTIAVLPFCVHACARLLTFAWHPRLRQCWNFLDSFREVGPTWLSFPGYFKYHGYSTYGSGKTYHPGLPKDSDGALSWSTNRTYEDYPDRGWNRPSWVPATGKSSVMPDATPPANLSHYRDGANLQVVSTAGPAPETAWHAACGPWRAQAARSRPRARIAP